MNVWKFLRAEKDNVVFFQIPSFKDTNLVNHCFTTRIGGISKPPYAFLNLGTKTNDNWKDIYTNYEMICEALNIDIENLVLSDQVHKDEIMIVGKEHRGNGIIHDNKLDGIDALITNEKKVALVTLYADCVPVFILDRKRKVIALAHGGWRGTVKKIGKRVIERMVSHFNSSPDDCIIGIGPSIGKCCYEVDEYVIRRFKDNYKNAKDFIEDKGDGRYFLDLWEANKSSLMEAGVPPQNITTSNVCTKCNNDLFFSYRAEKGETGRMAAILQLI